MDLYFDTSVQSIRLFYPKPWKEHLRSLTVNRDNVFIAQYSWLEFYVTCFNALTRIFWAAFKSDTIGEINTYLSYGHHNKSYDLLISGYIIDALSQKPPFHTDPKMVAARARMLLEGGLKQSFYTLSPKEKIQVIDQLNCSFLKMFEAHQWVEHQENIPKVRPPQYTRCSKERAHCDIKPFVANNSQALKVAKDAMLLKKRDKPFTSRVDNILENVSKIKGDNCRYFSDWLMITQAPAQCTLFSMDQDWQIISSTQQRPFIRVELEEQIISEPQIVEESIEAAENH